MNRRRFITILDVCSYSVLTVGMLCSFIFDVKIGHASKLAITLACAFLYIYVRKYFLQKKPE